eukprot:jgi/Chlat1/8612/Chrsp86S08003
MSNELPAKRVGRAGLPPWSEAEQQAVREFWEGLCLSPQQVATLIAKGMSLSLYRSPKELERRLSEIQKLLPGVNTKLAATLAILERRPETFANNHKGSRRLLSISVMDLCIMLRIAPQLLTATPEAVAKSFAAWRTLLAVDHAQMVVSVKRCPQLICNADASVRIKASNTGGHA